MKQTRRFLALLLALCLSWTQISPALAVALEDEQTEPVAVVEETVAPEVVETEAAAEEAEVIETEAVTEAPEVVETEAPAEEPEVVETEAVEEEVVAEEAANEGEPVGTWGNPEPMTLGKNTVTYTPDSNFVYYYFSWEAPAEGLLTVDVDTDLTEWDFECESDAGFRHFRLDETADSTSATARVSAGDKLKLEVYAGTDENGNIISGTFTFTASFDDNVGTKELPIRLYTKNAEWNEDKSVGTMIVTAPVGTTWYDVYDLDDKIVKVDGIAPPEQDNGLYTTGIFPITNNTGAEKDFVVTFCDAVTGDLPSMPIVLNTWSWTWDTDRTVCQKKITVPAGITWYRADGNEMNIYADGVLVYEPTFAQTGSTFSISNDTGAEKEVTVKCTYPLGIQGNYDNLTLGSHTVEIKEGQYMGYGYRTVVNETTDFTFTIDTSAPDWSYKIWAYGTDNRLNEIKHSNLDSNIVDTVTFTVGAGNPLVVIVGTSLNMGTAPAGTVSFELKEAPKPGSSAENPIELDASALKWDDGYKSARMNVTVPVGTTWYSIVITDMVVNVNGMPVSGKLYGTEPQVFSITNDGEAEAEYEIILAYPVGSAYFHDQLVMGDGTAYIAGGNRAGYWYDWTAEEDGTLTVEVDTSASVWKLNVITFDAEGKPVDHISSSVDETVVPSVSVDVAAGDKVQVNLSTWVDTETENPNGMISFTASFAPPVGTEANPCYPEFQWNEAQTEATATVTVPAGTTYYCAAYRIGGMYLTINDGEPTLLEAAGMWNPVVFTVVNDGEEAAEFNLRIYWPVGDQMNPETMYGLGSNTVSLAEGDDGYFYNFTVEHTGTLYATIEEITEGVVGNIIVNNNTTYAQNSLVYDGVDGVLALEVTEGDELNIQVVAEPDTTDPYNWVYPAAEITWNINYALGSELNPIAPEWEWNGTAEAFYTVTIPAGATYHFAAYRVGGMYLTINDGEPKLLEAAGMWNPVTFTITNDGAEAAEYSLHIYWPVGGQMNPETMYGLGRNAVSLAEGSEGYFYNFIVEHTGTLYATIEEITEGVVGNIIVNNNTTYAQNSLVYDGVDGVLALDVTEGDELVIQVAVEPDTTDPYNWVFPAADITWNINYALGSELNPCYPEFQWNETQTEAIAIVTVPAGTTYYCAAYRVGGMLLSINGGEATLLESVSMWDPTIFTIVNDGEETADFELKLTYPVGNRMNPAELLLADEYNPDVVNIATVEEGNWDGYAFAWTAPEQGELTITMHNGKAGWNYSIQNMTTYASTEMHASADDPAVYSETVSVNAGDEIWVMVNTCGASIYDVTPAGDVYFTAEYVMAVGIPNNPIWIYDPTVPVTGTIEAKETLYFSGYGLGGMTMTVANAAALTLNVEGTDYTADENGTITLVIPASPMGGRMPVNFTLTAAEAADYEISFQYPVGTSENPAEMVIGQNSVTLEEGAMEYFYSWTAADRGELTITMAEGTTGWQYCVNNMTSYIYGDYHWSDEDPTVAETVSVNKGDIIEIKVLTYDPMNPWMAPAGTVSFTADFVAAEGTENNPIWLYDLSDWINEPIPANTTVYFSAYGLGGMYIDLYSDGNLQLEVNGETHTAPDNNWINVLFPASPMGGCMPVTFAITNTCEYDQMASFHLYHPYGSMGNPAWLNMGKTTIAIEENDQDGYVYHWIAETDGYLTVTMTGKVWSYTLNNLTTYAYGDNHSSNDETVVKSQTIKVTAGDEIQLIVATPVDYNTSTSPAAKVKFTAAFASTEYNLLSGMAMTLKFTDPATGKAVSGSKVTWEITSGSEFATLKNGKLTANKGITEASVVTVAATYGEDVNAFVVTIYPAATEVKIYTSTWDEETQEEVIEEVTGKTVDIYTNGNAFEKHMPSVFAVVGPENAQDEIIWKSSNYNIANIDPEGHIMMMWSEKNQGIATGKVTFTATAADGSGKKATVKLNISTLVEWMQITGKGGAAVSAIGSGKSVQLAANVNADATNKKVTWEIVRGEEYATISASGKLTANKGLTTGHIVTVQATAQDAGQVCETIDINVMPLASKVAITTDERVVDGKFDMNIPWPAFNLSAEVLDADGTASAEQKVVWKSSNTKVATIDESGSVYCNKPGTVTFTATATDGSNKKATVKVTIIKTVSELQLPSNAIIAGGKALALKPVIVDADATNKKLSWSMTMEDGSAVAKTLATLSASGKLSTKKVTEATNVVVTCTTIDGSDISASCIVTIYPATTKVTIMQYGEAVKGTQAMTVGDEEIFYAECLPENAADQYTWKSSNEKIARIEVNSDGSVTIIAVGEKTGTVTITATAIDGTNKKATMKIKVTRAE